MNQNPIESIMELVDVSNQLEVDIIGKVSSNKEEVNYELSVLFINRSVL